MAMLVKRSGHYNYRVKEHTDQVCTLTFYERDGDKWAEIGDSSFSMDDAKRADLVKPDSGWAKYPRAMLFSRTISQGARIYAPDAIGGIYTDEEIRAIPPRPTDNDVPPTIEVTDEPSGEVEPPLKPAPEATGLNSSPPSVVVNGDVSTDELLSWIAEKMAFKNPRTSRSWIVNKCKIEEGKIDSDPGWVKAEVATLQNWTL